MKKVMYVMTSLSHKRVFESFVPRKDLNQLIVGPKERQNKNAPVPEDYRDFKIRTIKKYNNKNELQKIVNEFKPDVYVQASLPVAYKIVLPKKCKRAYVSHGLVGGHVKGIIKKAGLNTSVWKGCDLYCGVSEVFSDWVKKVAKVGDDKILLNALPQLDILYDENYYKSYKQKVLKATRNPSAKKVVLFAGFCCKDRYDMNPHNEDYFKTAIELEKIAKKNNWLVMIKPRQTYSVMMKFLKGKKWGKKYIGDYKRIQSSKHTHFITTTGHIYRYFFVDAFVINGTSTIEIEACAIQKPLFVVRTNLNCPVELSDPLDTIGSGAAMSVMDLSELEHDLIQYFKKDKFHRPERQRELLVKLGIDFDGKMHERIQNRIARI